MAHSVIAFSLDPSHVLYVIKFIYSLVGVAILTPASQMKCPLALAGIEIATPALQLQSPFRFEEKIKLVLKNRTSREKNPIKPSLVPFDRIFFVGFLVLNKSDLVTFN